MTVDIHPDILRVLLGLAGTAVGYAVREYQNRIVPFFQVFRIEGSRAAAWEIVSIPDDVRSELVGTFYIKELQPGSLFGHLFGCWDRADDVIRFWPEVKPLLGRVLSATTDADLEEGIYRLCNSSWFDQWFVRLVSRSQLHFDESAADLSQKVQVLLDKGNEQRNGVYWVNTVFGATLFGQQMNNPAMLTRFERFVDNIRKLDAERIRRPLTDFQTILEKEHRVALSVVAPLRRLVDSCARWGFFIAFTNLSTQKGSDLVLPHSVLSVQLAS